MHTEKSNAAQAEVSLLLTLEELESRNQFLEQRIVELEAELRLKDETLRWSCPNGTGDLISNLAHQWLQPVNNISLIVQGLQLALRANDLSIEEMNSDVAEVMKELQQISETITGFRESFHKG